MKKGALLCFAADPHAFGVVTRIAERAGAAGADPLAAALMALLLLLEPLFQRLHDLVPRPERLARRHLLGRQIFLGDSLPPVLGNIDRVLTIVGEQPLENLFGNLVETADQAPLLQ